MALLAGRYRVLSPLGSGGMGEVVLAEDSQLRRRVAIKFSRSDNDLDALARERFRREALAAAAIDHPFICKIHEIGEADGRTFIVMEYVEGETLQALASRGLLPLRQVAELANELAQALEEAHRRSLLDAGHASNVARGRAMIEAAAADFETLKMPVYVELARRMLLA